MKSNRLSYRSAQAGFSLVEVALAVAIAALGIVTCLGLLPEGLEMSRKTAQLTINRNIIEQIIRDLENVTNWRTIKPKGPDIPLPDAATSGAAVGNKVKSLYNDQGLKVTEDAVDITYVTEADFTQTAFLSGTSTDQPYLARVVIRIATTSRSNFSFDGADPNTYTTFHHLLAKTR